MASGSGGCSTAAVLGSERLRVRRLLNSQDSVAAEAAASRSLTAAPCQLLPLLLRGVAALLLLVALIAAGRGPVIVAGAPGIPGGVLWLLACSAVPCGSGTGCATAVPASSICFAAPPVIMLATAANLALPSRTGPRSEVRSEVQCNHNQSCDGVTNIITYMRRPACTETRQCVCDAMHADNWCGAARSLD